jgi:hypothetical protein
MVLEWNSGMGRDFGRWKMRIKKEEGVNDGN